MHDPHLTPQMYAEGLRRLLAGDDPALMLTVVDGLAARAAADADRAARLARLVRTVPAR